ncbi:hypothetical protein LX97_01257 [Nonlabens dokdonensis]|jgi:uncharacterized membrane protein YqiK|uniref:Band 7 domain-containing protein n=2 Tax=Nonlabens dokdonensis TaxID=328515 RepID=A0ABX5Q364_9FLAO|nr:SPFH domain-containing protein [Nonlabens dokdonensis]AGC76597.1 putative secreted protein [Nonlabens dokdonensis DSW-6]PZX44247.1 hypothetical protein LX97_01257 [Nonlabens dokdonensis]
MDGFIPMIITLLGMLLLLITVYFLIIALFFKKAPQGFALIRTGIGGTKISTTAIYVVPVFHQLEMMDMTIKQVRIELLDDENLICQDDIRVDIKACFHVQVGFKLEHIKSVAGRIGATNASDPNKVQELFEANFTHSLKTVAKIFKFEELLNHRDKFRIELIKHIGVDLYGFLLADIAIDYIEKSKPNNL